MKKFLCSITFILAITSSLHVSASKKQLSVMNLPETCATQTLSAKDEDGNVLYSVTCTRCDENPVIATIKAGLCAQKALDAIIPSN